jgi:hypothetical protein
MSRESRREIYGVSLGDVDRVVLTYLRGGRPGEAEAELVAVEDPEVLRHTAIGEPFGLYIGLVPPTARRCKAVALDRRGEPLGVESCQPFEGLAEDAFVLGGS